MEHIQKARFRPLRTWKVVAVGGVAALVFAACNTSDPLGNVSQGPATHDAVELTIEDGTFDAKELKLPVGEEVTVEITNRDGESHDFAIDALELNTGTIESGGVATATFTVPQGSVRFACSYHDDMRGSIVGV